MKLHELKPAEGSKQAPKRKGRGIGSGLPKISSTVLPRSLATSSTLFMAPKPCIVAFTMFKLVSEPRDFAKMYNST